MIRSVLEVKDYLDRFMAKTQIWGIVFINREKNLTAMTQLSITPAQRTEIINSLTTTDYVETMAPMAPEMPEAWVFGKQFDSVELYIKVSMGYPNSNTICISLHIAEYPINYAFK